MRNKMIRLMASTAVTVVMASIVVNAMPQAALAAAPAKKATGSIVMSGPKQAAKFEVFDRLTNKGSVTYSNFELADESGVFVPNLGQGLTLSLTNVNDGVTIYPGPFTHTVTIDSYEPQSPTKTTFVGHGSYDADSAWTETIVGSVEGTHVEFSLIPDDGGSKYGWTEAVFDGSVASDGTMSGTLASDDYPAGTRTYDWAIAGAAHSVFNYTALVTCVKVVDANDARFGYTIPSGHLHADTPVAVTVHDGGSSGVGNDTWAHTVGSCDAPGANYPITAGNLTVFGG